MPASRSIDHVVLAVRDLEDAAAIFEAMGFTLTPRAQHPWGTDNRLIQLADQTFIEVLEVARPELILEADHSCTPAQFSFGAHTRAFLKNRGAGVSMLALKGWDASHDTAEFANHGLGDYAPFPFGRIARQPDGSEKEVAFELAFAHPAALPDLVFFTCHNKFPENFWKPDFQIHGNGVTGLMGLTLGSDAPNELTPFLDLLAGDKAKPREPGGRWQFGPLNGRWQFGHQWLDLVEHETDTQFTAITFEVKNIGLLERLIAGTVSETQHGPMEDGYWVCHPAFGDVILRFIEHRN